MLRITEIHVNVLKEHFHVWCGDLGRWPQFSRQREVFWSIRVVKPENWTLQRHCGLRQFSSVSDSKLDTTTALRSSSVFFSLRLKTGHHNGIAVFVSFLQSQTQTLTLSRDDLLELKMVITLFTVRTKSKLYANFLLELYRLHKMYQMNVIYRRIREFLRKEYSLAWVDGKQQAVYSPGKNERHGRIVITFVWYILSLLHTIIIKTTKIMTKTTKLFLEMGRVQLAAA